jgi:hypothetical protein
MDDLNELVGYVVSLGNFQYFTCSKLILTFPLPLFVLKPKLPRRIQTQLQGLHFTKRVILLSHNMGSCSLSFPIFPWSCQFKIQILHFFMFYFYDGNDFHLVDHHLTGHWKISTFGLTTFFCISSSKKWGVSIRKY